eukprot:COSAG01_NODE_2815_length_7021_cov_7.545363_3_plen_77_part_00
MRVLSSRFSAAAASAFDALSRKASVCLLSSASSRDTFLRSALASGSPPDGTASRLNNTAPPHQPAQTEITRARRGK